MIGSIAPYVSKFRRSYQSNDVIDRLNYQYTALMIAFAAFTLAATQYVGKPIQCWVPAQFTGAWEKYTETYCFIKGSYFQHFDKEISDEYPARDRKKETLRTFLAIAEESIENLESRVPLNVRWRENYSSYWLTHNIIEVHSSHRLMSIFVSDYLDVFRSHADSGDIVDILNYRYTSLILLVSGFTLAGMLYMKQPIQCWLPAEFTPQWEEYAETFCFVHGSYHVKDVCDPLSADSDDFCIADRSNFVGFYQWLPLVSVLQAFLFLLPLLVWRVYSGKSGINVKGVLNAAAQVRKKFDTASRTTQVQVAANHLEEVLEMQKELKTGSVDMLYFSKRGGFYLVALYLTTKVMYVFNTLLQLLILNFFLGSDYTFWGYGILKDLLNGAEWHESGHFPRVTMCDFHVRVLGNLHRWTVQCVLMINMFNEKIYIFLWWWLIFVGVLSLLSLMYYLVALIVRSNQRYFVERYLRCTGAISQIPDLRDERHLSGFIYKYLRPDGVFLLRLIETNGGDLLVGEITNALFERYRTKAENSLGTLPIVESPISSSSLQR